MKTFENEEFIIGGSKFISNGENQSTYHVMWLDTGARSCGFGSAELARKWANELCIKRERMV